MRRLSIFSALLGAALCFAQGGVNEYSVPAHFGPESPTNPLLARVDPANDRWVGERDFQAINRKLHDLAEKLKKGEASFKPLAGSLQRFENLELVEFKIVGSSRADAGAKTARMRVRAELGGRTPDKKLLSLIGEISMQWSRSGQDWQLQTTEVSPLREAVAPQRYFTDISEEAFGANRSFQRQLSKSVDDWRGTLDAAVGVSVYGHQGLSVGDYDGDGIEDVYISQPSGLPNLLYRNNGDGTFSDVTVAAGLDIFDDTTMSLFADVDNDGDQDLIAIAGEGPLLFRNDGRGRFSYDPDSGLRLPPNRKAVLTGAAMADYDLDGDLDLYAGSYDFWQAGAEYDTPTPYYDATNGPPNFLFRNRGDGTFEEVTEKAGLMAGNNRFSFAPAWGDYDNDADPDLYVANDFGRNNLYRNNGDGTFTEVTAQAGVEDMAAGMSAAWGDYDNDGDLDLYVGNMWSSAGQRVTFNPQFDSVASSEKVKARFRRHARGNSLFRNNGDGTFSDVSKDAGVTMGRWAWASDFLDFDNDGRLDLFVLNGFITGERLDDL